MAAANPDGIDINLACYAPVIRQLDAGSALFENFPALQTVLTAVRKSWPGPLTVKIRLGHATIGHEERFVQRLRLIEDIGIDAVTLHTRFFEDKFKRRSRHELFAWAAGLTRLPVIANGDIAGAATVRGHADLFRPVSGFMIGRMAIARPWLFAHWDRPGEPIDYPAVWRRLHAYICEDFQPAIAIKRIRLFTKYYARNFHFGHTLEVKVQNCATPEAALEAADRFFATPQPIYDEPSLQGL